VLEANPKVAFPGLFSLACFKDTSVVDHVQLSIDSHQWNINLIKAPDWKVAVFTTFFNLLYSFRPRQGGEDKLCWAPFKSGLFDVESFYNVLVAHNSYPSLGGVFGGIRFP
jgi:hypothetical protein